MEKNCKAQVNLGFVKAYPGSEIYEYCVRKNIMKNKLNFIKFNMGPDNILNMTKAMSSQEFKNLEKSLYDSLRDYGNFVSPKIKKTNRKNIYFLKIKCPFCKETVIYKNCLIRNKFNYNFGLICRNCNMCFSVRSFLQRIRQKNYFLTKLFITLKNKIRNRIN